MSRAEEEDAMREVAALRRTRTYPQTTKGAIELMLDTGMISKSRYANMLLSVIQQRRDNAWDKDAV